jgi:hypothetical protein
MAHEIQRLLPRHFKILELMLAGYKNVEIAEVVGCTRETVYAVSRSPLFVAELNRRMKDQTENGISDHVNAFESKAKMVLQKNAERAAKVQEELLESEDDSIRFRSSAHILDRVLGKPTDPNATERSGLKIEINGDRAQLLITALKESKHASYEAANGSTAQDHEGEQGDVHQAPALSAGLGHRQAEAQGSVDPDISPRSVTGGNESERHADGLLNPVAEAAPSTPIALPSVADLFQLNGGNESTPNLEGTQNG